MIRPGSFDVDRCQLQRVLVVEEHELLLAGLRAVLTHESWVSDCLVAPTAEVAWQIATRHHPQLVIISTSLPGRTSLELCRLFKVRMPHVRVALMSSEGRVSAALALLNGAVASISKQLPTSVLAASLRRVAEGGRVFPRESAEAGTKLSARELDVLQLLATGRSNPEMALELNLSRHTIKQHTSAVYRKLGVRNRAEAASRGQELGLLV
ncbi:response regulator transcription factor [Jatrophihabitans fulvus]